MHITPADSVIATQKQYEAERKAQHKRETELARVAWKETVQKSKEGILDDEQCEQLFQAAITCLETGQTWARLLVFPCEACTDRGIALNAPEFRKDDWPLLLCGEAACVFFHFDRFYRTKPEHEAPGKARYRLRAPVISYRKPDLIPEYAALELGVSKPAISVP